MTPSDSNSETQMRLRRQAEARLHTGTAPLSRTGAIGPQAQAMLYDLAKAPTSASAALGLLHELQVHQVELDMQLEQLERTRVELTQSLERYVERFKFAPTAYLAVSREGLIVDGNLAADHLLEVKRGALVARRLESFVTAPYRLSVAEFVKRLCGDSSSETCEAQLQPAGNARSFQIVGTALPSDRSLLITLLETTAR